MRSINKVIIIGNLTRDPEIRQTPNGQSVCTFGIATNREWVTKEGDKKGSAEFHECVAWAHLAEICQQHLKKGNLIYVEGYLKTRNWETPEGVRKFKTEIVVQDMIILEKRQKEEVNGSSSETKSEPSEATDTPAKSLNESTSMDSESTVEPAPQQETASEESTVQPAPQVEETAPTSESSVDSSNDEEDPINKDLGL